MTLHLLAAYKDDRYYTACGEVWAAPNFPLITLRHEKTNCVRCKAKGKPTRKV